MSQVVLIYFPQNSDTLKKSMREGGREFLVLGRVESVIENAVQTPPVAIIVDTEQKPEIGLSAIKELRSHPTTKKTPILAITASNSETRVRALEAGANEFLTAPLDWIEVRVRLNSLTQKALPDAPALTPKPSSDNRPKLEEMSGAVDVLRHDLRSAQGIMFSGMELLREVVMEEQIQSADLYINIIKNMISANKRQLFMLDDLLDWFELIAFNLPIAKIPFETEPILLTAIKDYETANPRRDVTIILAQAENLPKAIGDPQLLQRVLNAALDTAVKFCLPKKEVKITLMEKAGGIEFKVSDPGRPVDPAYDEKIFDPAIQSQARHSNSRSSVAMSLPFIKQAIEQMGGSVTLESDKSDGLTTLVIWLPSEK